MPIGPKFVQLESVHYSSPDYFDHNISDDDNDDDDQGPEHCQSLLRMRAAVRTLLYDLQLQIEKNFAAGTLVSQPELTAS